MHTIHTYLLTRRHRDKFIWQTHEDRIYDFQLNVAFRIAIQRQCSFKTNSVALTEGGRRRPNSPMCPEAVLRLRLHLSLFGKMGE